MKNLNSQDRCPDDWSSVVGAFEQDLYRQGKSEVTIKNYASAIHSFGAYCIEKLNHAGPYVSRLTETDVFAYIDFLKKDRLLALPSLNRTIASFRSFALFLLVKQWHRHNIAQNLKHFHLASPGEPPSLSAAETRRLLTSIPLHGRNGLRDYAIVQVLLQCGLRIGEIARLVYGDLTLNRTNGRIRVRDEKGHSERIIPLNSIIRKALSHYLAIRGVLTDGDPLFCSERNKAISTRRIQHMVKKHLCAAGRQDLSAHDLRHHFAVKFYEKVGKLTAVQKVLGHRQITTTARYAQVGEKEIADAMEQLPENAYSGEGAP